MSVLSLIYEENLENRLTLFCNFYVLFKNTGGKDRLGNLCIWFKIENITLFFSSQFWYY